MVWKENVGEISHKISLTQSLDNIEWTVPNLIAFSSSVMTPGVTSPWFNLDGDKWRLVLIPNNKYSIGNLSIVTSVGLFLWRRSSNLYNYQYNIQIGIRSKVKSLEGYKLLHDLETKVGEDVGVFDFLPVSYFSTYKNYISPTGNLKIFCHFKTKCQSVDVGDGNLSDTSEAESTTLAEDFVESEERIVVDEAKGVDRLHQNLERMFVEGLNSDFILRVENNEFPVHRCILSARSTVFASMFEHDMSEKNSNAVDIPDCSAESFKVFLRYLYTGRADTISSKNVFNLYYAADKYDVNDLKEDCLVFVKDNLSVDTFCEVMVLSLRHCESELLKKATDFFRENIKAIIKTVQWQKYLRENPTHANELFIKALVDTP